MPYVLQEMKRDRCDEKDGARTRELVKEIKKGRKKEKKKGKSLVRCNDVINICKSCRKSTVRKKTKTFVVVG